METLPPAAPLDPADLEDAIRQEFFAPALLPYNFTLINALVQCISEREARLAALPSADHSFAHDLLTLELDRLRYYLKKYLRLRIAKIERNILFIFQNDLAGLLSKPEFDFAFKFYQLFSGQLSQEFFSKVEDRFGAKLFQQNALEPNRPTLGLPMADTPDENRFVFVRFVEPVPNVVLDRGLTMRFAKNDILLSAFKFVKGLIDEKRAKVV